MKVDFIKGMEKGIQNLHTQGAFLTVKDKDKTNTMTISWGNIGFMWQKPIFTVMVRKSRYTYEFIENADNFTVSIPFNNEMKNALSICGSRSGRDIDKCSEAGISFINSTVVDSPIIDGCKMYYECKIVNRLPMDKERQEMLLPEFKHIFYRDNDYHTFYYGEIVACYEK